MKYVTTKMLEYYSATEELPTIVNKTYLCRVIVCGSYGKHYVFYNTVEYRGGGEWKMSDGIVTHWAEIPEVYDVDDDKKL